MKNVAYFVNVVSGVDKGRKYLLLTNTAKSRTTTFLELKQGKIIDVMLNLRGTIKKVINYLGTHNNKLETYEITDNYYFDGDDFNIKLFLREYEQIKF